MVKLIDLSRELYHRAPTHPDHPPMVINSWVTHEERKKETGGFSSTSMVLSMGDHAGTHVDAPRHFNADPGAPGIGELPLEHFYTEAVCLDLSRKPSASDITIANLEAACRAADVDIQEGDTVFLYTGHHERTFGTPAYLTDFPGLTRESAEWIGRKGIVSFGVEAVSPGRPGENNFEVHRVCAEMGFTHMESLMNLEALVGKGRFRFAGFPLKIRGGSGSPIRAVAILEE
tara:strand:+ start:211 stop:903 length:693 start_codon:yes stop_codon:yes gene_type:complete